MAKHTQTIPRQQPTNCLSVFDHFAGLAFKGLSLITVPFCTLNPNWYLTSGRESTTSTTGGQETTRNTTRLLERVF